MGAGWRFRVGNDVRLFEVATGRLLRVFCAHTQRALFAAFTSDGASLLTTGFDETIRVWDPNSGKLKLEIEGFEGPVQRVALSPDGTEVAAICDTAWNGEVRVFDLATGTKIRTLPGRYFPHALTYSRDGKSLAAADTSGLVHVWDRATGIEKWSVDAARLELARLDFSPDGELLAVGSEKCVQVFRTGDKQLAYRADGGAFHVQFTPDGRRLVTANNIIPVTGKVIVRDAATGAEERAVSMAKTDLTNRLHFALSPDGAKAACTLTRRNAVLIYDLSTGKLESPREGHLEEVVAVSFSPNGKWIASGGQDRRAILWDAATGRQVREFPHDGAVDSVEFSPDSKVLATSDDFGVRLWDPRTGVLIGAYGGSLGKEIRRIAATPDGRSFAVGASDGTVRFVSTKNAENARPPLRVADAAVRCVAFSDDGRLLAAGAMNGKAFVFDRTTSKITATLESPSTARVSHVRFVAGGQELLASQDGPDGKIRRWDLKSGEILATFHGHATHVSGMRVRYDGRLMATGSAEEGILRLWEPGSETPRPFAYESELFGSFADQVAFSSDGKFLAVGAGNGMIAVLKLPDPKDDIHAWFAARTISPGLSHEQWLTAIRKLTPGNLVQAVSDRIREANPGADGIIRYRTQEGRVAAAQVSTKRVRDLSPLQGLPDLTNLEFFTESGTPLADLSPLRGLKLEQLDLGSMNHPICDLRGLEGMPLKSIEAINHFDILSLKALAKCRLKKLDLWGPPIEDLSPLRGQPITEINLNRTRVKDISVLKELPVTIVELHGAPVDSIAALQGRQLTRLDITRTKVADLGPLRGMTSLRDLKCSQTPIRDLSPLEGIPLEVLEMKNMVVPDLSPLVKTNVRILHLDFVASRDAPILRQVKSLEKINDRPAADVLAGR